MRHDSLALARDGASRLIQTEAASYAAGAEDERPLGGYGVLLLVYFAYVSVLVLIAVSRRVRLPERIGAADLVLMSLATHKVARILTKDPVTSPFRAAFTRFEAPSGEGEISEAPRGRGVRHAVGELVTCPFCIGQWVATFFLFGLVVSPRLARLAASVFTVLTGSDLFQLVYAEAQQRAS